jgi:hypothetical protein
MCISMGTDTFCDEKDSSGEINKMFPCAKGVTEGERPPVFEGIFSVGAETVDSTGGGRDEDG